MLTFEEEDPRVEVDESAFVDVAEPQFVSPGRAYDDRPTADADQSPNPATDTSTTSIDSGMRPASVPGAVPIAFI